MKNLLTMIGAAAVACGANASSITIDSVVQRWPWNNKVDITYTVTNGQKRAAGVYCGVEFNVSVPGYGDILVHGYSLGASAEGDENGKQHTVTWTAPSGVKSTDCTISATLFSTNVPSGNDYMIVDLDSGETYYEGLMDTQDASNSRYNTDDYKTDKLVLRKIPKWADHGDLPNADALTALGGYPTGDDVNYSTVNSRKNWQTAKDYYAGVFLVTLYQYTKLGLSNPSTYYKTDSEGNRANLRPVQNVSWIDLRTNINPTNPIPAVTSNEGKFFQRLNFKTGFYFDLPTEVMFEIAQRAGATTSYSWGNTTNELPNYCICKDNSGMTTWEVGSKLPNNWGLYDTAGNVWEWPLDKSGRTNLAGASDPFVPEGTGSQYRTRGWGWCESDSGQAHYRASYRATTTSNGGGRNRGFRVFRIVAD